MSTELKLTYGIILGVVLFQLSGSLPLAIGMALVLAAVDAGLRRRKGGVGDVRSDR